MEPGFELLPHIREPGGVFVLRLNGRVVYVGRSKNLYARAANVVTRAKEPFPRRGRYITEGDFHGIPLMFDEVWVKFCGETEAVGLVYELIERHKPEQQPPVRLYNLTHRRRKRFDLGPVAQAAGVKLDRTEKDNRRVP